LSVARDHIYITGKSGIGKSSLLFNLAETELIAGGGFLFIVLRDDTARKLIPVRFMPSV
jgi:ABC-type ATPase involved in cell division